VKSLLGAKSSVVAVVGLPILGARMGAGEKKYGLKKWGGLKEGLDECER
jgi:hypothetical protein